MHSYQRYLVSGSGSNTLSTLGEKAESLPLHSSVLWNLSSTQEKSAVNGRRLRMVRL